jgi:hypothetical protein
VQQVGDLVDHARTGLQRVRGLVRKQRGLRLRCKGKPDQEANQAQLDCFEHHLLPALARIALFGIHCTENKGHAALDRMGRRMYLNDMTLVFDLDDRARLRERFFGATRTVWARA